MKNLRKDKIYLSSPDMSSIEKDYLINSFKSNWIAPIGPDINAFEKEVINYLNIGYGCALSSGTSAIHMALKVLGIKSGDVILCQSFTFVASANPILYEKAIPIFIDSDPEYWTLNISYLEDSFKKYKPKALICADIYGQSCDYESISYLCKKYDVFLIEDSAEALGSEYKNKKCGNFGSMGIFSFNGNKIITTSGGGMLVSDNKRYIEKAKYYATQSRSKNEDYYEHKEVGFNYRISNLLAAIGRGQLKRLEKFIQRRREIFSNYYKELSPIEGISFMPELPSTKSNRWLTTMLIDENKNKITPQILINALKKENIESRMLWKPMHLQKLFKNCIYIKSDNLDYSKSLFEKGICLPSGSNLSENQQSRIIDLINDLFKH